jgi:Lon protease-like protein
VRDDAETLPIFPLAGVVLFPHIKAPLHIFEPRYRQMVEHALAGERRIATVVVRPEGVSEMAGDAPIYSVGCAGTIEQFQRYADGRYDIVLHGTQRVRIEAEPARPEGRLFRSACVRFLDDPCHAEDAARASAMREQAIANALEIFGDGATEVSHEALDRIDDSVFVNVLCAALPFSTLEKQALIEVDGIRERFEALIELFRFARIETQARRVPNSGAFH